jgi:hypothetical protein
MVPGADGLTDFHRWGKWVGGPIAGRKVEGDMFERLELDMAEVNTNKFFLFDGPRVVSA